MTKLLEPEVLDPELLEPEILKPELLEDRLLVRSVDPIDISGSESPIVGDIFSSLYILFQFKLSRSTPFFPDDLCDLTSSRNTDSFIDIGGHQRLRGIVDKD